MFYHRSIIPLVILLLLTTAPVSLSAQATEYSLQEGFELKIEGTSNVRDWDAVAESLDAVFLFRNSDSIEIADLSSDQFERLELRIPVESLQSDGRRLTNNVHDYLEKDDHPVITFDLRAITRIDAESSADQAILTAEGVINAAGQDHTTEMQVTVRKTADGGLRFTGSQDLKMTDFDISPPRAMMGTIRSDDEVIVHFDVTFKPGS